MNTPLPRTATRRTGSSIACCSVGTDEGLVGWSDIETAPHVAASSLMLPGPGSACSRGFGPWSSEKIPSTSNVSGTSFTGDDLLRPPRRGHAGASRRFDIACHDLMGKATGLPVHKLLGGARRDRVRAYASTLFRSTPDAMRKAASSTVPEASPPSSSAGVCSVRIEAATSPSSPPLVRRSDPRSRCSSTPAGWSAAVRPTRSTSADA